MGLAIGVLLEGSLYMAYGWQGSLTQMGFYTKATLVTFGGAYAVLPYVYMPASGRCSYTRFTIAPGSSMSATASRHRPSTQRR